jgi:hypothetical protein
MNLNDLEGSYSGPKVLSRNPGHKCSGNKMPRGRPRIRGVIPPLLITFHGMVLVVRMEQDYVSELWPPTGILSFPRLNMGVEGHGEMISTGDNRRTRRKTCNSALCPPQIPHGLTGDRIRDSAVRARD